MTVKIRLGAGQAVGCCGLLNEFASLERFAGGVGCGWCVEGCTRGAGRGVMVVL